MNRRNFLKIVFAAGVATAIPVGRLTYLDRKLPVIVGDGVHDDTAGLQAALNGEPFYCKNGTVRIVNGGCHISGGAFCVSDTLHLGLADHTTITHNYFVGDIDKPFIHIHGNESQLMRFDYNVLVSDKYTGFMHGAS